MVDWLTLLAFVPAALALNLTPGADMMFCLAQGLRRGAAAAAAASAGISVGCFLHAVAAGLGLSALVAAHPAAFEVIRWAGVAYLLWLALQVWRGADQGGPEAENPLPENPLPMSAAPQFGVMTATPALAPVLLRAFASGLVVNLTNPKVVLFVLAFLPQFVDPARAVLPQFLVLGGIIALGGFVINAAVGRFAGALRQRMAADPQRGQRLARLLARISAGVFAALALRLAYGAFAARG